MFRKPYIRRFDGHFKRPVSGCGGRACRRPTASDHGNPEDVLDQSVLYMRIYFLGMPVLMLYNFGAAILRAVGDTRRPLYFLFAAGAVNVVLNLFFVIGLGMGVDGVAWLL